MCIGGNSPDPTSSEGKFKTTVIDGYGDLPQLLCPTLFNRQKKYASRGIEIIGRSGILKLVEIDVVEIDD